MADGVEDRGRVEPVKPTEEALAEAARLLRQGELVAFPTETVYGLGADALNPFAVARIFEVKGRPRFDPLIVHLADLSDLDALVVCGAAQVERIAAAFWPGPLTLVLPKRETVPDIVTAGLPTVAVRIPRHPVARRLLELTGRPVAAPSANPFGRISPTTAGHVARHLGSAVPMILDGGPCAMGLESTILSLADPARPVLLRPGAVPAEELRALIGELHLPAPQPERIEAPGMIPGHYAPRTPIRWLAGNRPHDDGAVGIRIGLLAFAEPAGRGDYRAVEVLSARGDLKEAAANLFAALHRLDEADLDLILVDAIPRQGLGCAIHDRLRRAMHRG